MAGHELLSRLGSGGMSNVYLAEPVQGNGPQAAIKVLRRDLAQDPVQRDRFLREAGTANRIAHPNVVEIRDFGETEDGLIYLVMERVRGRSLLEELRVGPMAPDRALRIAAQIASGLGRAHARGIVHRDLKPENVLLTERDGEPDFVKVLDFGIAKIFDAPSLTGSQQIFGTPGYIAPEYIQSTDIDGRSDLYSLGVILYEMVTGALPFDYEYPGDLLVKHVTEQPIPPRARLTTVPPAFEELILRCLRKDPDDRFQTADELIGAIARVRDGLGGDGASEADGRATLPLGRFEAEVPRGTPATSLVQLRERLASARARLAGAGASAGARDALGEADRALAAVEGAIGADPRQGTNEPAARVASLTERLRERVETVERLASRPGTRHRDTPS